MKFSRYLLIFLVVIIFTGFIMRSFKRGYCKYLVILDSKEKIEAKNLNWYKSGFVDIRRCDGKSTTCMDNFIDTVIIK